MGKEEFENLNKFHSFNILEELVLYPQSDYVIWNEYIVKKEEYINSLHPELYNSENYIKYLNAKMDQQNKLNSFELLAGFLAILIFLFSIVVTTIDYQEHNRNIQEQTEWQQQSKLRDIRKRLSNLILTVEVDDIKSEFIKIKYKFDQESWNVASDQISMTETLAAIDELIRNEITYVPEFEEHEVLTDLGLDLKMIIYNLNNDTIIKNANHTFVLTLLKHILLIILLYTTMYVLVIRSNRNNSVKLCLIKYQIELLEKANSMTQRLPSFL